MINLMLSQSSKNILSCFVLGIMFAIIFIVPTTINAQCADGTTSCLDGGTGGGTEGGTGGGGSSQTVKIINPFKTDSISGLIKTIVDEILLPIGGVIAVLMIMYAGFLFVTARGDTTKIAKARETLLYAVIGAAILLGAWVISEAIQRTIDQLRI